MTFKEFFRKRLLENKEEKKSSFRDDIVAAVRQHVKDPHKTISSSRGDDFDIMDHAELAAKTIEFHMKNPDKVEPWEKDKHTKRISWLKSKLPSEVVDQLMKKHFGG